ncbi:uncharacterized protein LAJ45_02145 [Morchella importuna]|uniref:uncharacterized protein n=1 Tax=Morchella importuna TaxID=1174673 RepID=UPI001E8D3DE8|nr:uncharacterized protein LAJ45_02145 [Morchella importuna]KAH8154377.1 hypothetical protein LAJ45_02145 [Morchella importuna]
MVGHDVDQKYLGKYAKSTAEDKNPISAGLYKLLGLSTLLSRKLLRARKQRKLDPTRTTKSLDLYRHIIWMAREGLGILHNEIQPEIANYPLMNELRVLIAKLNASYLHIFVLFDHTYETRSAMSPSSTLKATTGNGTASRTNGSLGPNAEKSARDLLPGSHPLRLSVKLEYSAFLYDCTRDYENARRVAQKAVDEAFASMDAMDDDAFEDAMELVGSLGVLAKRSEPSPKPSPRLDGQENRPNRHAAQAAGQHVI